MGRYLNVHLTDKEEQNLVEQAKAEVRSELTDEAIVTYIKNPKNDVDLVSMLQALKIKSRAEELESREVSSLNNTERLILAIYWLMYKELR